MLLILVFMMKSIDSRIRVDIDNDRIFDKDIVKLSKGKIVKDYSGNKIILEEGMYVYLYTDDVDDKGDTAFIFSEGIVIKNPYGNLTSFDWFCRLKGDIVYVNKEGIVR